MQLHTLGRKRCAEALTPLDIRNALNVRPEQTAYSKQKIRYADSTVISTISGLETLYTHKRNLTVRTRKPGRCSESNGLRRSDHEQLAAHPRLALCIYVFNDLGICVMDDVVTNQLHGYHFRLNEADT
jgi:hypothetical protein